MEPQNLSNNPSPVSVIATDWSNGFTPSNPPLHKDVIQQVLPQQPTTRSVKRSIITAGLLGIFINFIFMMIGFALMNYFQISIVILCILAEIICGYIGQKLYNSPYHIKRYLGGKVAVIGALGSVLPIFTFFALFAILFGGSRSISMEEYTEFFTLIIPIFLLVVVTISLFGELGAYFASKKYNGMQTE